MTDSIRDGEWLKLTDCLCLSEATRFASKIQREDTKLKALGSRPNNLAVEVRKSREMLNRVEFAVWVIRTYYFDKQGNFVEVTQ